MASPLELLGLQNGLGPAMTGINQLEANENARQMELMDMYMKQQQGQGQSLANQKAAFDLSQAQAAGPSALQATIAGNEEKVGASQLAKQQQMGEMINQIGGQLERVPPEQRMQLMQAMAQRVPTITKDPTFQMLMQTDPTQLPNALKQVGTNIMLQSGEQLRKQQLQTQGEDARFKIASMQEGGANARAAAGRDNDMRMLQERLASQEKLERERIDAGKYQKRQSGVQGLMDVAGKAGYEKAATAAMILANDKDASEEDRAFYRGVANEFATANERQKAAGGYAKPTLDPNSPTGLGTIDPYGMQGGPVFNQPGSISNPPPAPGQRQALPVPKGLPPGTVNNGDGTFTLPDGRKGRFK